ncbi:MAG TPA: ribosome maturation factor RimM [Spirochaetia bacterium]|nr:ribosome maturation factor RimM [Spirochaetales bacterium]HRS64471.1 ribosome maturation factor RimM [Spirochaetia bacterium]HOT60066.1 ribosome maturation factor RimM [Spirochaetales bacterium]HPD79761.1 ribosome maturation factor RimM [Spirochaetales bacterium]HQK34146.1 ribosome maturation factor RimM [Spirochaetales bacterium]
MNELAIGKVVKVFGLDGRVKIESFSGEFDHFLTLSSVMLRFGSETKSAEIETCEFHAGSIIARFKNCTTAEQAQHYVGWELWVERSKASPLKANEYYYGDLTGCNVMDGAACVGIVTGVLETAGGHLLEVQCGQTSKLVPFRNEFIGTVDIQEKKIELLAPWILE